MDDDKRKSLEAAGFRVGSAADFLNLSDQERQMVELRLSVCRAVRARRQALALTQKQVANRMKSSQSRVAKIESASPDVSLDLMFSVLFALGGGVADLSNSPMISRPIHGES